MPPETRKLITFATYSNMLFGGMKRGMILVYIETLIMTNNDEGIEKLANTLVFRSSGGIFLQLNL